MEFNIEVFRMEILGKWNEKSELNTVFAVEKGSDHALVSVSSQCIASEPRSSPPYLPHLNKNATVKYFSGLWVSDGQVKPNWKILIWSEAWLSKSCFLKEIY
ncbi:hypothetical protein CDAR_540471 [Caerostris darwini]|uniref:Uncharacterized protein n=1 Tax=Caerostris darwini TaxID=1538125 RepID=A0AAV4PPG6_9ARAC|nr:hypothetical protein CDAR_540471 [Caerostris darwini]